MKSFLVFSLFLFSLSVFSTGATVEKWPNGRVKKQFTVDKNGLKQGTYIEYSESGKILKRYFYVDDMPHGGFQVYIPESETKISGKYNKGILDGPYTVVQGKSVMKQLWSKGEMIKVGKVSTYPKALKDMQSTLDFIYKVGEGGTSNSLKLKDWNIGHTGSGELGTFRKKALQRLLAYRYICDVPWIGLTLDEKYNEYAQEASKLCKANGGIDHHPPKPADWSKKDYDFAHKGTASSNLASGQRDIARTVDAYMDDSDKSNIDRVGHRRWCINPRMGKTGFGYESKMSAMWSFDKSGKAPKMDFVSYPARGYMPIEYFSAKHAWSISPLKTRLNKNMKPKINIYPLDKNHIKGKPLEISYMNVETGGFGSGACLIFLPKNAQVKHDVRYWVEISLDGAKKRPSTDFEFLVHFIDIKK